MAEPRPPLAGQIEEFQDTLRKRATEPVPLSDQHSTYLIRRELEKGDTSFYDLLQELRAIRPEITREYLREMLDLGVREGVIEHLPDNSWRWKGKPRVLGGQIDQLSAADAARLRAWLHGPNGSLRFSPWLTFEAVEGGGVLVRTARRASNAS